MLMPNIILVLAPYVEQLFEIFVRIVRLPEVCVYFSCSNTRKEHHRYSNVINIYFQHLYGMFPALFFKFLTDSCSRDKELREFIYPMIQNLRLAPLFISNGIIFSSKWCSSGYWVISSTMGWKRLQYYHYRSDCKYFHSQCIDFYFSVSYDKSMQHQREEISLDIDFSSMEGTRKLQLLLFFILSVKKIFDLQTLIEKEMQSNLSFEISTVLCSCGYYWLGSQDKRL